MISDISHYWSPNIDYYFHQTTLNLETSQPLQLAYINLLICERGSAHFSVNFQHYLLQEGETLFVADDVIVMLLDHSEDFSASGIFLKRIFAAEVAYQLPNPLFSYLHHNPIIQFPDALKSLINSWHQQSSFIQQATQYQRIMLCNHLQNYFLMVVNLIPQDQITQTHKQSRQEILCWRFWDLIGKHAHHERSVQFYAKKLSITPYYLAKISQTILNDAPKTLIDRQVILEVKRLLTNTHDSIEIIADKMHFKDPSYLSRYFKKMTNMTLSQFRQQTGNDKA